MDKGGWIRVVESFMAIALLLAFLLVFIGQVERSNESMSAVERTSITMLKSIESEPVFRNEILSLSLPSNSDEPSFPSNIKDFISENSLLNVGCHLYVCSLGSVCLLEESVEGEVYSSESLVFSNETLYSPRKIKIFCY